MNVRLALRRKIFDKPALVCSFFVPISDIPATLTPQRIDAMLSGLAEVCFAGVNEAGDHLKAAEDAEAFERTSRAL